MEKEKYLRDIREIKVMMSNSSQFLSLSGLSGVVAGIYSLIAIYFVNSIINKDIIDLHGNIDNYNDLTMDVKIKIIVIALFLIFISISTCIFLTSIKAKKLGVKLWESTSKNLLLNFGIPIVTGGIFCILLLIKEYFELIIPATLLFYGLACINASRNTFRDVKFFGITLVFIGLFSTYFTQFGLYFWGFGFGICHIIYGGMMYLKYDRNV